MIVVVMGPPCGGKSFYVRQEAKTGDVIIDMDVIAMALEFESFSHDYDDTTRAIARAARNAAVSEGLRTFQGERRRTLFIIHTDPPREMRLVYRAAGARFVIQDPGKKVCLERAKNRPLQNQKLVRRVLDDYYSKRV